MSGPRRPNGPFLAAILGASLGLALWIILGAIVWSAWQGLTWLITAVMLLAVIG